VDTSLEAVLEGSETTTSRQDLGLDDNVSHGLTS
jgi:hypothetical protein